MWQARRWRVEMQSCFFGQHFFPNTLGEEKRSFLVQNLRPTTTTSKQCTWVSGDRTVAIFHIHNPGCLLPPWSVRHFEGKHAADFLHQLLSFLQENREGFLIVPQMCSKDIRWHGNSPSSQSIQWIFILVPKISGAHFNCIQNPLLYITFISRHGTYDYDPDRKAGLVLWRRAETGSGRESTCRTERNSKSIGTYGNI